MFMDMNFINSLGYSWSSAWTHAGWISKYAVNQENKCSLEQSIVSAWMKQHIKEDERAKSDCSC